MFGLPGCSKNLTLKTNTPTTLSQNKVVIPKIFQSPVKKNSPVVVTHHTGTFVECPVCMVEIPQRNINSHLDDCLKRSNNCSKYVPVFFPVICSIVLGASIFLLRQTGSRSLSLRENNHVLHFALHVYYAHEEWNRTDSCGVFVLCIYPSVVWNQHLS